MYNLTYVLIAWPGTGCGHLPRIGLLSGGIFFALAAPASMASLSVALVLVLQIGVLFSRIVICVAVREGIGVHWSSGGVLGVDMPPAQEVTFVINRGENDLDKATRRGRHL